MFPWMDLPLLNRPRPLRWLYVDLNSYFASVEQQVEPRLRGRPVIVAPVMTDSTSAIAASYEAKAFGIRTGTPIWQARRRCPDLVVVPARHALYVDYHQRIFAEVERHLPVTRICSIDEAACRLADNENSPARARALAGLIKQGIVRNVGAELRCSIGVAPTRLLAKMASDMRKPDGLTLLTEQDLPQRLHALALDDIPGVGGRMKQRLLRANIHSIEQLLALGPTRCARVWGGAPGARLWAQLMGIDHGDPVTHTRSIGHSHVLAPADRLPEPARLTCRRLLLKAASRARAKGFAAREISLSIRWEDRSKWRARERLAPSQDSTQLIGLLDRLWSQAPVSAVRRPRAVGVTLSGLEAASSAQGDLFAPPGAKLALWQAVDAINQRFGRNTATLGALTGGRADRIGAVIAFNRIPTIAEFRD